MSEHDAPNLTPDQHLERLEMATETELAMTAQMEPTEGNVTEYSASGAEIVSAASQNQTVTSPKSTGRVFKSKNAPKPVTVPLSDPIEIWEDGELVDEITEVTLKRPRGKGVVEAMENDTPMLALVCGLEAEVLEYLDGDDFILLMEKATPFFPKHLMERIQKINHQVS
ncbi:phage tail assembly protein [Pseudovibrio ascidiaceicola]|uniref:phage tail assembly protein n=1 Tax=Pseudovibrio ascidiaceicola TaxID=285279 RepID=UPI003D360E55